MPARIRLESRTRPLAIGLAAKAAAFHPPLPASWRVYRLRLALGWTQHELAARAGVSERTIEALEAGRIPEQRTSRAILRAFGLEADSRHLVFPGRCGRSRRFHAERGAA